MPLPPTDPSAPRTGLLLTGGGARAAYQVGVLEAIADLRLACGAGKEPNPFPIVTGTSAGAINAAALACGADQFDRAVRRIVRVWSNFHAHHVYRADSISVMRSGARWLTLLSLGWVLARWRPHAPALIAGQRSSGTSARQDGAAGAPATPDPPGSPCRRWRSRRRATARAST
jgi:NTE family protein